MTTKSPDETTNRKSIIIAFAIGFVIAFAISWFYFSRAVKDSIGNQITAGELMEKEAASSKPAKPEVVAVEAPVAKSTYDNGDDELATQLMSNLFSDSEQGRKLAKKALVKKFHDNPKVMKALIDKCSTEFDKKDRNDNGIFQGIDVLSMVSEKSPETLRAHKKAMYAFFEKTKGQYRERTQERMEALRRRLE